MAGWDPWRKPPQADATWEAWRSREIRMVKPFKNSRQEDCYRDKAGNVIPREVLHRQYERLDEPTPNEQIEHSE